MDDHSKAGSHKLYPKSLSIAKVIAPYKFKREIIRAIEKLEEVEPIMVDPRAGADEIAVEERRTTFEAYRSRLNSFLNSLDKKQISKTEPIQVGMSEEDVMNFVKDVVDEQALEISEVIQRREAIAKRQAELQNVIKLLERFDTLEVDHVLLADTDHTKTYIGTVFPPQIRRILWYIEQITEGKFFFLEKTISEQEAVVLISMLQKDADAVIEKLKSISFQEITVPEDEDLDGLSISDCLKEQQDLEMEDAQLVKRLEEIAKEKGPVFMATQEMINIELDRISVELKMRRTETTVVLWAWIPETLKPEFETAVHGATDGTANFDFRKGDLDPEASPSYVTNSKFMAPMRGLVTAYGTPSHDEIDPYPFVKYLFPILFGIMFADVGHGLLLTLFGLWAYNKKKKMDEVPSGIKGYIFGGPELLIVMGLTSMFLGFPLHSVFGDETILYAADRLLGFKLFETLFGWSWDFFFIEELHGGKVEIHRNYLNFLIFSFAVGAIVIVIGLLINIYQLVNHRHSNYQLYAAMALFGTYFFILLTAVFMAAGLPSFLMMASIVMILVSIFTNFYMENKAHGFEGIMLGLDHTISLMANTFSFGRLLAMNTIHFVLATLPGLFLGGVNHYRDYWNVGDGLFGLPLSVWYIISSVILGSVIVVPVETVFSTLQALRLNWVEFFGKFYKGQGKAFTPVKAKRLYTFEA